jgi:hypothetical protein
LLPRKEGRKEGRKDGRKEGLPPRPHLLVPRNGGASRAN